MPHRGYRKALRAGEPPTYVLPPSAPTPQGRRCLPRRTTPDWNEADVAYLQENYGLLPDPTLARKLRRTVWGVRIKAARLGLTRSCNFATASEAGRILGVDSKTVKAWITKGYLRGCKSHVGAKRADGHKSFWCITWDELERFVRERADIYDWRLMDAIAYPFWTALARKAAKQHMVGAPKLCRDWTPHEDALLIRHHTAGLRNAEIGARLGRTEHAVHYRKNVLRHRGHILPYSSPNWRNRRRRLIPELRQAWSAEQDAYLTANWGRPRRPDESGRGRYIKPRDIAPVVGQTSLAVLERAARLGLTKGRGHRTDLELEATG